MKAKLFLMLCLFIGMATIQLNAQDKSNRASQGWFESSYWSPVFCDGELIDVLEGGTIQVHYVFKMFKNGSVLAKEVDQIKGTVMSQSGETFTIRETDKSEYVDHWVVTWHYNLIGDRGSHYTGWITYDYSTGEITVGHTTCS